MEPIVLRASRSGIVASFGVAAGFGAIGAAMVASGSAAGWALVAIAAVGLFAGVAGLRRGTTFLRIDDQGVTVKGVGLERTTSWTEVESFEPTEVVVARNNRKMPCVRIHFYEGFEEAHTPQERRNKILGRDPRYLLAAYGNLSNVKLAELLNAQLAAHR
jgi:hypothetical protein